MIVESKNDVLVHCIKTNNINYLIILLNDNLNSANISFIDEVFHFVDGKEIINEAIIIFNLLVYSTCHILSKDLIRIFRLTIRNESVIELHLNKLKELGKDKDKSLDILIKYQIKNELCFKIVSDFLVFIYDLVLNNKLDTAIDIKKINQILTQLMFFPYPELLDYSILVMNSLLDLHFKCINEKLEMNSQKKDLKLCFFDYFTKSFLENILNFEFNKLGISIESVIHLPENFCQNKVNDSDYFIKDILVLTFVYQYKVNLNLLKEKFATIGNSDNNISITEEIIKSLSYFQQFFYGNFFMKDLFKFIKKRKSCNNFMQIRIENIIICTYSEILYFFNMNSFEFNSLLELEFESDYKKGKLLKLKYNNKVDYKSSVINSMSSFKKWENIFKQNYILASIYTINEILKDDISIDPIEQAFINAFNFNDIFLAYKKIKKTPNLLKIFINCLTVYYLMFSNDILSYDYLIIYRGENKLNENAVKFISAVIKLLWEIKIDSGDKYSEIKDDLEKLMNEIITSREESLIYLIYNDFEEDMIKFLIENIESSHISSKYFDDFILSKEPQKILSGFILLGHWANTYPVNYIYTRILDVLFIFRKNVDLRLLLTSENNINKFFKGVYLLFKAFPKLNSEFSDFLNFIRENTSTWISDYSLNNYTRKMLDKVFYFSEKVLVSSNYYNLNNNFIQIN